MGASRDATNGAALGKLFSFFLAVCLVVAVLLADAPTASAVTRVDSDRYWGSTRVETSIAIGMHAFPSGANVAYLASSTSTADALAAGSLMDGPVILNGKNSLDSAVRSYLLVLKQKSKSLRYVYLLGGYGVLSDNVLRQVRSLGFTVGRIAGANRYETAEKIAQRAFPGGYDKVYVADGVGSDGLGSPDAVVGGVLSGGPLLFGSTKTGLTANTRAMIYRASYRYQLGGQRIPGFTPSNWTTYYLAGADRYATATRIAAAAKNTSNKNTIYLANGMVFVDAVAGGELTDGTMLLTSPKSLPAVTCNYIRTSGATKIVALGGTGAVSAGVLQAAKNCISTTSTTTSTPSTGSTTVSTPASQRIATGTAHTCVINSLGKLKCWGNNVNGQVGIGSTLDAVTVPAQVTLPSGRTAKEVTAGVAHSCAIDVDGTAYCWGDNTYGQLGTGNTVNTKIPKAVSTSLKFKQINAGNNHTCAVTTAGKAYCWGNGAYYKLGNNSTFNSFTPVAVSGGFTFVQVVAGNNHSCGITSAGKAYCWGSGQYGQLGDNSTNRYDTNQQNRPVAVSGTHSFSMLSANYEVTCGVTTGKLAYCWGDDTKGQVGNGGAIVASIQRAGGSYAAPQRAGSLTNVTSLSVGSNYVCAVVSGTPTQIWCWGLNDRAQFGLGVAVSGLPAAKTSPVRTNNTTVNSDLGFASKIAAGGFHTCSQGSELGNLFCWGDQSNGQLGNQKRADNLNNTQYYEPGPYRVNIG
ncbi:MAG: cell wall-binding repeat-containing protein [Varibaculum sp.]|nr:cell wall-binding repeat-containing protein [Varibaculum sp.]